MSVPLFLVCVIAGCGGRRSAPSGGGGDSPAGAGQKAPAFLLFVLDTGVAEKHRLKLGLTSGTVQRYLVETVSRQKAWERKSTISFLAELEQAVVKVTDGRATVRVTLPRLLAYRPPVGREAAAHALSKWAVVMEVDESGRVFSVKGEGSARALGHFWTSVSGGGAGVVLPEKPVGIGAKWRVESNVTLPQSGATGEGMVWVKAVTTYRLAGVQRRQGRRLAALEAESVYQVLGGKKAVLGRGEGTARLTLDVDRGAVETVRSTVSLSLRLSGTSAEFVELKQKVRMENLAKRQKRR